MPTRLLLLLLLLFLTGYVFTEEPPDVECLVVHLKEVKCTWDKQGIPAVNYTVYSWFNNAERIECTKHLSENGINTGCIWPCQGSKRFDPFYTELVHGNTRFPNKTHLLKNRVQLFPPVNLTVQNGSDFNLWFNWNQISSDCVESEVRFRTNNKKWETSTVSNGRQSFCINLPSSSSRYELQVRSRLSSTCGESLFWSNWSKPVTWGINKNTDPIHVSMSVWTPVVYVVGAATLILLVVLLLRHERFRIIPIPVVPKLPLVLYNIEDWLQFSKGLKGNFKTNYNEPACPVREYCHVSQSDSESSDSSTSSITTNQTDCSIFIPGDKSNEVPTSCSSSTSRDLDSSQEE